MLLTVWDKDNNSRAFCVHLQYIYIMIRIWQNRDITALNSFGVTARASQLVEWEEPAEIAEIAATGLLSPQWMPLGGGNNILFTQDYNGTLLHSVARRIETFAEDDKTVSVKAMAGVDWGDFTAWCGECGLWGVENLTAIPGTVGACAVQNIGAYGAEAKDVIVSVECWSVDTGNFVTLAASHCGFGYRDSVFKRELKGRVVITAVNFVLSKEPSPNLTYTVLRDKMAGVEPTINAIARAVREIRDSKLPDPRTMGNAGSFFKNPIVKLPVAELIAVEHPTMPIYPSDVEGYAKLAAGWLIDAAGWKGRSVGRVGIHRFQALIVVNLGGATGREIADFARLVQDDVKTKFGVELETEVNIV
jgi:UDP-N-acetylmuramate dehydrogenase